MLPAWIATLLLPFAALAYEPEQLLGSFAPTGKQTLDRAGFTSLFNPLSGLKLSAKKDEFNDKAYSFGLKLKPKGLFEAREYHRMGSALNRGADLAERGARSDSLVSAYQLLIQADFAREQEVLQADLKRLAERGAKLSSLEAQRSRLDAKSALKAGLEVEKLKNDMAQGQAATSEVRALLQQKKLRLEDLNPADLLSPEEIYREVTTRTEAAETLTAARARSGLELDEASSELRRAQNRRLIDELELFSKTGKGGARIGFEVTLNLPFLAAGDLSEYKDQMKLVETRLETERAVEVERVRLPRLAQQLKDKIEVYRFLEANSAVENAAATLQVADAGLLLELRRTVVQRKLQRATLVAEIRTAYVEYLAENGVIADEPSLNHLSRSKRRIN